MAGSWMFRPQRDAWCYYVYGRAEITLAVRDLEALQDRTGWSRREALAWVETRPQEAPTGLVARTKAA